MFEARFRIAAQVESNEQGQRVFHVTEHGAPANEKAFSSLVTTVYQQEVYRMLQAGDTFTITVHLDLPPRETERTVRFREDGQFEGDGMQEPTPDLLPMLSTMYEQFLQQVDPGDVFTVMFRVQRL
ncbi:MAG: hypothetical protein ACJ795_10295 [Ktedonobacteraceae bacterium]